MDLLINNILSEHFPGIAVIVDSEGKILTNNAEALKQIPRIKKGVVLFDVIEQNSAENLHKLFIESKDFERIVKDEISLKFGNLEKDYQVVISLLSNDGFLITASITNFTKPVRQLTRFSVPSQNIDQIVEDFDILGIIEQVKSSFPFTFIGKSNLQRSIDQFKEYFWIKDRSDKYIIVNKTFSDFLGLKNIQIEGKSENDFLPKYVADLNRYVNNYIRETANTVVLEGLYTLYQSDKERPSEIVEFPICDIDNNVVAIIGFTQIVSEKKALKTKNELFFENSVFRIPEAILLFDKNKNIVTSNEKFNELFRIPAEYNLTTMTIDQIFEAEILEEIIKFMSTDIDSKSINVKMDQDNIAVNLRKIIDEVGNTLGYGVYCQKELLIETLKNDKVKMYEQILEASPEPMFIYDIENLKFLEVNNAALKLYGYSRSAFLQMDLTDLYAPEDIQNILQSAKSIENEKKYTGPWRQKKKDGSSIFVEISRSTFSINDKKVHFNLVRDVTEKIAENNRYQLYQATFENTSDLIIQTDRDGFIFFVNEYVVRELGYSKMELQEKTFISLLTDKERGRINSSVFQAKVNSKTIIESEFKKSGGEIINSSFIINPVFDFDNQVDSYIIICKLKKEPVIIVEEKITAAPVSSKPEDSKNINGIDAEFLSGMFHEILTPINVIIGFGQELSESVQEPTEEQKEASSIIKENQKMLMQLMDTVSEYVSIETNRSVVQAEEISITEIIDSIILDAQKAIKTSNVEITYGKISSSLKFENDKNKINAFFTEFVKMAGLVTKNAKVYVSAYQYDNTNLIFSVRDEKNSVSDHLINSMKDILIKDENTLRKTFGISRFTSRLFKKLNIILGCKTETVIKAGEKSEFGILLPLKFEPVQNFNSLETDEVKIDTIEFMEAPAIKEDIVIEDNFDSFIEEQKTKIENLDGIDDILINNNNISFENKPTSEQEEITASRSKVERFTTVFEFEEDNFDVSRLDCLYLEDQIDSQILFKVQMKELKSIEFAPSLEKALPSIKTKKYDFLVLDMNLQGEYNGLDALRIIRKMPGYEYTPIIAVTAYVLPGDKEKFIAAGFNDFISKPIMRDKLLECLKNLMGKKAAY